MIIKKQELLKVLQNVFPGIETNLIMVEGSDCFYFDKDKIYSYNDHVSISHSFKSDLQGSIRAEEFYKLIQKLNDEIEINQKDDYFEIKSGKTKAKMKLLNIDIYKYINEMDIDNLKWNKTPDNFFEGIEICIINNNNSHLKGFFVKDDLLISSDEIRLSFYNLDQKMDQFWVNDLSLKNLLKIKDQIKEYSVSETWVFFKDINDSVFSFKRNNDELFPIDRVIDYSDNIFYEKDDLKNVFPDDFIKSLERVSIFSRKLDEYQVVNIRILKDKIFLSSNKEIGEIKESIDFEKGFDKDVDISINVDFNFLMEVIKKCPEFYIKEKIDNLDFKILVFENDNFKQILSTISE